MFAVVKCLQELFNMTLSWIHFLWDIITLSSQPLSSLMSLVCSLGASGCTWRRAHTGSNANITTVCYFSYNSIHTGFRFFYFQHYLFWYLAALSSLLINSLLVNHFCKMSQRFISARQGSRVTAHFAISVITNKSG